MNLRKVLNSQNPDSRSTLVTVPTSHIAVACRPCCVVLLASSKARRLGESTVQGVQFGTCFPKSDFFCGGDLDPINIHTNLYSAKNRENESEACFPRNRHTIGLSVFAKHNRATCDVGCNRPHLALLAAVWATRLKMQRDYDRVCFRGCFVRLVRKQKY